MFAEFRARYPNGSLTSEIIEVNQGKFIVRAAVTLEGTVLATGFGASEQLEEAEDRARLRALEAVGLFLEPADRGQAQLISSAPTYQLPAALSVVTPISTPIPAPLAAPMVETAPMVDVVGDRFDDRSPDRFDGRSGVDPTLESTSPGYEDLYEVEHGESDPLPTMEPEWPPEPEPEPAPAPAPKRSRRAASPPAPTPTPVPTPAPAPAPTDLSDAIAQTDVLMKRLGWNKQQGVEYLQMAFGKRTRAQLTDRELLQFLQHLQTLADDPDF